MNWLQYVLALIQLTPDILKLILQLQGIFGASNNPTKKAIIMAAVAPDAPPEFAARVSKLIDSHVESLKLAGKLPSAAAPEPPSTT